MDYFLVKWIHIISSTILFGTGLGSAFYMFMANRSKEKSFIHFATKYVVIADWVFTTPAVIIQLGTGLWLMHLTGRSFDEKWILQALILYVFVGLCWLPVVWMQIKMRDIVQTSILEKTNLPKNYW